MQRLQRSLLVLVGAVVVALVVRTGIPLCPTASVLGIPCPGCGLTRATLALLSGDFKHALELHPLVFVLTPLCAWLLGIGLWSYIRGPRAQLSKREPVLAGRAVTILASALLVVVIGVWASRFFGYFGGPVPVQTFRSWAQQKFNAQKALSARKSLDVEPKVNHVAVADNIVATFDCKLTGFTTFRFGAERN